MAERSIEASPAQHIAGLDGVRTLAILMVMVFHFFRHGFHSSSSLLKLLEKIFGIGQTGVDLFFVLSGFLITGILLRSRGRTGALRSFYVRRTFRIFPLYYVYLIFAFVLLPALNLSKPIPLHDQWWFWLYCQNIQDTFQANFTMFGPGHFWSLAVEEHFYLVWPLIVLQAPERYLNRILLLIVGLAILTRALLVAHNYPVFYFTPCRMDSLAIGSLLAVNARSGAWLQAAGVWIRKYALWFALAAVGCYAILTGSSNPLLQITKFSITAAVYAALIAVVLTMKPGTRLHRVLGSPIAGALAKGSYAMYVFHPAIFDWVAATFPSMPAVAALPLAFLSTFGVAWLSWHLLENPFLKVRDRVQAGDRARPALA